MDFQKEHFACLALKHTPGLGHRSCRRLVDHFPSVYEALRGYASWPGLEIEFRSLKRILTACRAEAWRGEAEAEYHKAREAGMAVVTWFDPAYPAALRDLDDPPLLLYVQGDLSLLHNPSLAVVGARDCTSMGLDAARRISGQLSRIGITVISGLALGIDRQAHLGGLSGLGSSIAVLGCGLDADYPQGNRDVRAVLERKGLVVTEFGPGVGPRAEHFPFRNRIISGLSLGVLVAEAAHNSGSLITARLAGEQGRDVFALPGPLGSPTFTGCHRLIKQGASLVESAADIVEILRYDFARQLEGVPDPVPDGEIEAGAGVDPVAEDAFGAEAAPEKREAPSVPAAKPAERPAGSVRSRRKRSAALEREAASLDGEERAVMDLLEGAERMHIDVLGRELGWPAHRVSRILILLEMRGLIQQMPGMWYLAKED
ncbi:DNA-processing protein DprA [Pseudodesulfovibrio sp.]|uniref:DNA-processing protein DprA n=1 Tax=Pseudodesulfovibrio sp. TaxID=2035812 RepID=UPI00261EABB4|nr:DNA-processing protein DprA [Pseudodesulfovibrio sp.]MDD3312967.1 DNA-processing protein DprA [Pseudodesulfovibrio sp.]